ncbi:hypothetical protein [Streptomyces californicus]|uniref:hypothetical protein n=1 Tax=Streptomyces californicus TaxID=67351 RepID=UPI0037F2B36D
MAMQPEDAENDWLLITEALETAGWVGDADMPLEILRKDGAVWGVLNETGESGLSGQGWSVEFPSGTPTVVIVAACLAATGSPVITAEANRHLSVVPDPA